MIAYCGGNKRKHRQRNPIAVHVKVLVVCDAFVTGIPEESLIQDLLNQTISKHAGAVQRVLMPGGIHCHLHAHLFRW